MRVLAHVVTGKMDLRGGPTWKGMDYYLYLHARACRRSSRHSPCKRSDCAIPERAHFARLKLPGIPNINHG